MNGSIKMTENEFLLGGCLEFAWWLALAIGGEVVIASSYENGEQVSLHAMVEYGGEYYDVALRNASYSKAVEHTASLTREFSGVDFDSEYIEIEPYVDQEIPRRPKLRDKAKRLAKKIAKEIMY